MNANGDDAVSWQEDNHDRNSFSGQTSNRSKISVHHNHLPVRADPSRGLKRSRDISSNGAETCSPETQNRSLPVKSAANMDSDDEFFEKVFQKHTSPKSARKNSGGSKIVARRLVVTGNKLDASKDFVAKRFNSNTVHVAKTSSTDTFLGKRLVSHEKGTEEQPKTKSNSMQSTSLSDLDSSDDEFDKKKTETAFNLSGKSSSLVRTTNASTSTRQDTNVERIQSTKMRYKGLSESKRNHCEPKSTNSFAAVLASITSRKKVKTGIKRNDCGSKKIPIASNEKDLICLDKSSADEEKSDAMSRMRTAKAPVESLTSPTNQAKRTLTSMPTTETLKSPAGSSSSLPAHEGKRTLAFKSSALNKPSVNINMSWQNKPPGPDDPKSMTRNGFQWHWCQLCNKQNGRWSSHSIEDHGRKVAWLSYISEHISLRKGDTESGSLESFGLTNNGSNSEDPICLSSSEDEALTGRRQYASAVRRVKRKSAMKSSVKSLRNNVVVVPTKIELPSESKEKSNDERGKRSPIILDILDFDDDSSIRSKSNHQNNNLDNDNKSNVEGNIAVAENSVTKLKSLSNKADVVSTKLQLPLETKNKSNEGQGRPSPIIIDLLDSDDDSLGHSKSTNQNSNLDKNNKYNAEGNKEEKVGNQGGQDAAPEDCDSQNASDTKIIQGEAIQVLVSAEKELERMNQVPIKFAVLEEDKVFATDFLFHTMRQYICDMFNAMDGKPYIGFGCLKCTHCSKKISVKRKASMISSSRYWKHLNEECEKVPKHVKKALNCLKKYDVKQRKSDSTIMTGKVMEAVFRHMISAGTLMPEDRSDDEDVEADNQDDICSSDSIRIDESVSGQDLPQMRVVEWCKTLDKDHYPTVMFTAWNEKKDRLFDFKVFVAPSHITNSGNGAFLQLLRVRVRKPVTGKLMATRCPLLAYDRDGKEIKVCVGPATFHDNTGPSNDYHYVEENDLTYSSWHNGCGSIDIGSYGPFFSSDIKKEVHYEVKNFLFDYEPQGWSYGLDDSSEDRLVLDISDDGTGETHLRARENIPMHVNEVGHNPELQQNVTPLEPDHGIHYYAHPRNPMKVGEIIELLVDYGEIYEEVRERKGYGKSNLGCDDVESQRVKRNQGERVKIEDIIVTQSLLENYELLISLQDTISDVLKATNNCVKQSFTSEEMTRRWNARFRIHWIEMIFRHRCTTIRTQKDDWLCVNIFSFLDKMKCPNDRSLFDMVTNNKMLRPIAKNEYLEESVFCASRRHQLLHPLDPTMWCNFARKIVHDLGQELILDIKAGVTSDVAALRRVYNCATNACREVRQLCSIPTEIWRLSLEKTENECIVKYLMNSPGGKNHTSKTSLEECNNTGPESSQRVVGGLQTKYWVRWTKAEGLAALIDENWYLLWQVVRVVHVLVKQCLPSKKWGYSLKTLCEHVGVDLSDAETVLDIKMVEPYDEEDFVSLHSYIDPSARKDRVKQNLSQRRPQGKAPKVISALVRKILLDQKGGRQKTGFIANVAPNVVKNREDEITFWKEEPGGDKYPEGWIIHIHKRQSGESGGRHIDRYWFTKGGKKLCSTKEIERFLIAMKLSQGNEELAVKLFEGRVTCTMLKRIRKLR